MKRTWNRLIARLMTSYPRLVQLWARKTEFVEFTQIPWTPLPKPVGSCRLALVTTAGVHLKSQPAFDMLDPAGDPSFREIPAHTPVADLAITHDYYNHFDADMDVNIVFPVQRVRELEQSGDIGDINARHFSFMGHIRDGHLETLMNATAPAVAAALKADAVDIALLTPA